MTESESEWNVGNTRLPFIAESDVPSGKDNLVAVVMNWIHKLGRENLNATSTLLSGKITTTGVLNHLKMHGNQVQIINGELEKVLNKGYKDKMQAGDVIELMDGSEAFGKCTGMDNSCVKPVAWMLVLTRKKLYAQQMGVQYHPFKTHVWARQPRDHRRRLSTNRSCIE